MYEYSALSSIFNVNSESHDNNVKAFSDKVDNHIRTQSKLWFEFSHMDDTLLPEETNELSGIESRIIQILLKDLEDS